MTTETEIRPFSWSFSQLNSYETCPLRHLHYNILKDIEEPESEHLRIGNEVHKAFELRVRDNKELPLGMGHHEKLIAKLIAAPGDTHAEQSLALTDQFRPVGYFGKNVWFRTKIDFAKVSSSAAVIFDYKTGKPSEDKTQLKLMSATMFHHMPRIDTVRAAYLFVNHDKVMMEQYDRGDLVKIWGEILPRVRKLKKSRDENDFPPKPSGLCKKYCAVTSCIYHGKGG